MNNFNLDSFMSKTEKEYGLGKGEYLKLKEGDNKLRILSEPVPHQSSYKGQVTFKFLMFVLDRADGVIKPFFMPVGVMRMIVSLQKDADWVFDGFPMPYDININAKGAGTKEVTYAVFPSPAKQSLTNEQIEELSKKDIYEFQKKLNKSQDEERINAPVEPTHTINVDSIPF